MKWAKPPCLGEIAAHHRHCLLRQHTCGSRSRAGRVQCVLPCLSASPHTRGRCQGHGSSPQRVNILGCIRVWGAGRGNGCARPVLKHGPRSLTCMQACGSVRLLCTIKVTAGILHQPPTYQWSEVWVRAYLLGPERWWTTPVKGKLRGNSDGGS